MPTGRNVRTELSVSGERVLPILSRTRGSGAAGASRISAGAQRTPAAAATKQAGRSPARLIAPLEVLGQSVFP